MKNIVASEEKSGFGAVGILAVLFLLALSLAITLRSSTASDPLFALFASWTRRSRLFDYLIWSIANLSVLNAVPLVALLWATWFQRPDSANRADLAIGLLAVVACGIISRGLQIVLPTYSRPLHDPAQHIVLPFGVDPADLNRFHSFPSDHVAVSFALAMLIYGANRRLGLWAFAWATVLGVCRLYEGFHYPLDLLGGGLLGMLLVRAAHESGALRATGQRLVAMSVTSPATFYALAFLTTYQVSTLFNEIRALLGGLRHIL
jgi:undecaprenyl-diphosphatase